MKRLIRTCVRGGGVYSFFSCWYCFWRLVLSFDGPATIISWCYGSQQVMCRFPNPYCVCFPAGSSNVTLSFPAGHRFPTLYCACFHRTSDIIHLWLRIIKEKAYIVGMVLKCVAHNNVLIMHETCKVMPQHHCTLRKFNIWHTVHTVLQVI